MMALVAILAVAAFVVIVIRPPLGAYLYLIANPLVVGMARGDVVPVLRPNELLLLLIAAALATRAVLGMLGGGNHRLPAVDRVDGALILLAVTSSVIPVLLRYGRGLPVTTDDLLYATVLWKYFLLYRVFRGSIRTEGQVAHCLRLSMASAAVVAVIGMLQVANLFGVPEFLYAHYDQPFEGHTGVLTTRGTSTIGSSFGFADVMIMNFVIAAAFLQVRWSGVGRSDRWIGRRLLVSAAVLFLSGCIVAGAFSGYIGLAVAVLVLGIIFGSLPRLLVVGVPAVLVASAVFWPVIAGRLAGFADPSGLPHSWRGRWQNLQDFFFPELFSGVNWLVGVRPAARLPAPETWRDWVYIESGYIWLLWIGGIPLLAAFLFFLWVGADRLWRVVRERTDAVGVAAATSLTYLWVIATLMLLDPHLTVRGSADLFFPLLGLSCGRVAVGRGAEGRRRDGRPGRNRHLTSSSGAPSGIRQDPRWSAPLHRSLTHR